MDIDTLNERIAGAMISMSSASVRLRLVTERDAPFIFRLRTDPDLNAHLSSSSNELERQAEWIRQYESRHSRNEEHYFIVESDRESVGTIRMYDYRLSDCSFCWGSWIVQRGVRPSCALASVLHLYDMGFRAAGFLSARFDVRKDNLSVLSFHRRVGAQEVSHDGPDVHFRVEREAYEKVVRPKLLSLHAKVS